MITILGSAAAFFALLHTTLAVRETAPCISVTIPDFLTADQTHCYDDPPVDICTLLNENNTEEAAKIINCTNYEGTYKLMDLTLLLTDFVASTLPEAERNDSFYEATFIVNWCANGWALPTDRYNLTCDEYLAQVTVTCYEPVTLSVPDTSYLNQCLNNIPTTDFCKEGDTLTWQTFTYLISAVRCIYFNIAPLLPSLQ